MSSKKYIAQITERYVYDVIRRLPLVGRKDIERELRSLIEDMLSGKTANPTENDIDSVLLELGSPIKLAAKYKDGKRFLIGPEYYDTYVLVLKIACCASAFGLMLSQVLSSIMNGGIGFLAVMGAIASTVAGVFWAFGMVTLLFAIIERFAKKTIEEFSDKWYPNDLPQLPKKDVQISRSSAIASIVFTILVIAFFILAPHLLGIFSFQAGATVIPLFQLVHLRQVLPLLLIAWTLGILRDIAKLLIGRYDFKLCAIIVAADIFAMILCTIVFTNPNLWNPSLAAHVTQMFDEQTNFMGNAIDIFTKNFFWIIIFAFVLEIAETAIRTVRAKKSA